MTEVTVYMISLECAIRTKDIDDTPRSIVVERHAKKIDRKTYLKIVNLLDWLKEEEEDE